MQQRCSLVLLCGALPVLVSLIGCAGTIVDDGGGASNLRVVPGQIVRAQQQADGSFAITPQPLLAGGGSPFSGYNWSIATGSSFPPGTTVAAATGVFNGSGAGLVAGQNYPFTMRVSDGTSTASGTVTLQVAALPAGGIAPFTVFQQPMGVPVIVLPTARANAPYGASLQVYGGDPPYSWFEDETYAGRGDFALSGLTIDMARGVVRGTLMNSAAGKTLRFRIVVRDNAGDTAVTEPGRPV